MSTTGLVGLLNVHGRARCPSRGWYAKEPHDKGEKAVWFMVSTTTGTGGGNFSGFMGLSGGQAPFTCLIARVQVWY
jgi:hypothetical protein